MIFILLYQSFCIWLAYKNASWSNPAEDWKIKHWLNATLHITAAFLIGHFTKWNYGVSCLLFTRVVFDAAMNAFRHFGLGYVSPEPHFIDKIESKIVFWLASRGKVFITERRVEWFAIGFRLFILLIATVILFV